MKRSTVLFGVPTAGSTAARDSRDTLSMVGKPIGEGRIYRHGEAFPVNQEVQDPVEIEEALSATPIKDRFEVVAHHGLAILGEWISMTTADFHISLHSAFVARYPWWYLSLVKVGGTHPHVYSDIQTITDHRSAHGGARIYLAEEFPESIYNRIFMANIHEHALLSDILEPKGSGFVGRHGDDTVLANDGMWVGFSIEIGPDGAVYIFRIGTIRTFAE